MTGLAGAVVWGVVPYVPEAPFRIYAGTGREPFTVDGPGRLIEAARRGGDPDMTYLVPAKVRPVLILADAADDRFKECMALRLSRFSKLTDKEADSVRSQDHRTLVPLPPTRFPGLKEESAAMIHALVRVHRSALDTNVLGRLGSNELAVVHERFVRHHGFDLRILVKERLEQLAAAQRTRRDSA